ncbi:MAG: hypothetical protein NVS4B6_09610 [Mycobacterium sp.]
MVSNAARHVSTDLSGVSDASRREASTRTWLFRTFTVQGPQIQQMQGWLTQWNARAMPPMSGHADMPGVRGSDVRIERKLNS